MAKKPIVLDTNAVLLFMTNHDPQKAGKVISLLNTGASGV
jgi:hypothetical protein